MPAPYINWWASYPKSGSTWGRAFLEHYENGVLDINKMDVVYGDERVYYFQAVTAQPYHTMDLFQWSMVRPAALQMYLHMHPRKERMILKTHNAYASIGDIPLFPPLISGPSIYLVRNPLDVIPSFARHTGNSIDDMIMMMQDTGHAFESKVEKQTMIGLLSSWTNHVNSWTKQAPDTLVVRYEDLRDNPKYWFKKILEQLGYEINKDRLDSAVEATSLENLKKQEEEFGFNERGKNDVFFGGTKEKLTPKQITKVIDAFGDVMQEHGYLEEELKYGSNN